ncbi:hypothetical protein [Enterococcus avium]|uniref:hypothetical protein n=1 Tax=Enterococcus avium TaxID=33945 RepID=UPI001F584462|nr:hypothetical protein [Enterococcus avium]
MANEHLEPFYEENNPNFVKLSDYYNEDNIKLSDERIEELLIEYFNQWGWE